MKTSKKLLVSAVATAAVAVAAIAPVANAEVSASAGVASTYLWRGLDLGSGTPAVSGDITYSESGFYTGVWGSSGDTASGTEFDLYAGYGSEVAGLSYDVSVWTYVYPSAPGEAGEVDQEDTMGDLSELVVSLGYGPVTATVYQNLNGDEYTYYTLGGSFDKYSVTLGAHTGDDSSEFMHLDLGYAFNDSLSFTLSQVIDDNDNAVDDDLKFVVSYSLPIQ